MKSLYHRKRLCCLCLAGVLNLTGLTVCGKSAPSESYPDNSISYEEGSALTSEPTISTDESSAGTASPGQPTTRKPTTNRDTGGKYHHEAGLRRRHERHRPLCPKRPPLPPKRTPCPTVCMR